MVFGVEVGRCCAWAERVPGVIPGKPKGGGGGRWLPGWGRRVKYGAARAGAGGKAQGLASAKQAPGKRSFH